MTTLIAEVYDAFKDAGAEDTKARAAAQAIADYQRDISDVKSELKLPRWMLGTAIALNVAILLKLFT